MENVFRSLKLEECADLLPRRTKLRLQQPLTEDANVRSDLLSASLLKLAQSAEAPLESPAMPLQKKCTETSGSPRDRRAYPRRASGCRLSLVRLDRLRYSSCEREWGLHASSWKGETLDISMNGISFQTLDAPKPQDSLLIRINPLRGEAFVDVAVSVLRVSPSEDGGHKVIGRFARPLSLEQISSLSQAVFESSVI